MNDIHIILVEDEILLRDSLSEMLELSGIKVDGVGTAMELYQIINTVHFDVAVVDIGLPDQSGLKIVEFLRKNTNTGIILLTAKSSIADRVEGYNCGADLYFVKPVDCNELIAAIKSLRARLVNSDTKIKKDLNSWHLDKTSWKLICPEGREVKLTSKEMLFMETLMKQSGENISRETLIKTLRYPLDEYGSRSMDAMLLRLRKKCEKKLQKSIPVQTVRTIGYCFSSSAIILNGN